MIELDLPMPIGRIEAHPRVEADRGRVAVQRGPIVYCFEAVDNGGRVEQHRAAARSEVHGRAPRRPARRRDGDQGVAKDGRKITAVPYYAWDHREPGEMVVWVRQDGKSPSPKRMPPAGKRSSTGRWRPVRTKQRRAAEGKGSPGAACQGVGPAPGAGHEMVEREAPRGIEDSAPATRSPGNRSLARLSRILPVCDTPRPCNGRPLGCFPSQAKKKNHAKPQREKLILFLLGVFALWHENTFPPSAFPRPRWLIRPPWLTSATA